MSHPTLRITYTYIEGAMIVNVIQLKRCEIKIVFEHILHDHTLKYSGKAKEMALPSQMI